jgi:hypothetical protein
LRSIEQYARARTGAENVKKADVPAALSRTGRFEGGRWITPEGAEA